MTDIVERLREWSTCNVFPEQAQYAVSAACLEITSLRAEVVSKNEQFQQYAQKMETDMNAFAAENERLRWVLGRARTALGNMALENKGAIFKRWPINHEPLRADAKSLLPVIDAALEEKQ